MPFIFDTIVLNSEMSLYHYILLFIETIINLTKRY